MKKTLIVTTNFMNFHKLMKADLSKEFDVTILLFPLDGYKFRYKNFRQRLFNFIQKTFFRNRTYKKELVLKAKNEYLLEKLKEIKTDFDYALAFSVEYLNKDLLTEIKKTTKKMIAYQWDGLKRTPNIYDKIHLFDKFYAFDPADVDNKTVFFKTNFYFNTPINKEIKEENKAFYIGTFKKNRLKFLNLIKKQCDLFNVKTEFYLHCYEKPNKKYSFVSFTTTPLSYLDTLKKVESSKFIVDIKLNVHNGLSFRFFEALKYHKKIITNNTSVKNYDFYHPNNIFVFGEDDTNLLSSFLNSNYTLLPKEIENKYLFINWIKNTLNL